MIGSICDTVMNTLKSLTTTQIVMIVVIAIVVPMIVKKMCGNNSENFSTIKGDKPVFRMFHVVWCGHCKDAKPKFIEFMEKNPTINAEMIDAEDEKNKQLVEAYDIEGYPTFVITKDGKDTIYNGERTTEGFEKFAKDNL